MKTYRIAPLDTWFFRDGRPYNMDESSQVDVKSIFPPSAYTIAGALRASIARAMGWSESSKNPWTDEIKSVLGNFRENLGKISFQGPYIYSKDQGLLLPAPLHLLGKAPRENNKNWSFARLSPGDPVNCDLGEEVRLPSARDSKGMKTLHDYYFKAKDFETVMVGGNTDKIIPILSAKKDDHPGELWEMEYWVGLKRNPITLNTEDRALFSKHHIRMVPGVSLIMKIDGPVELLEPKALFALGGENRTAIAEALNEELKFPQAPELKIKNYKIRFTLTHITPACLEDLWPAPNGHLPGVPGKVISACLERPQMIGGWDSVNRKPLPLMPFVPAGSTWFCEANAEDFPSVIRLHCSHIGKDTEWGFGQVALGCW